MIFVNTLKGFVQLTKNIRSSINPALFHTSNVFNARLSESKRPDKFLRFNSKIYPPQEPGEEPRPAFVCHQMLNFKYSPDKMWYVAILVRGMTVDEALKQLRVVHCKGAKFAIQTIKEAQEMAVKEHNVEFRSNLWIAESFVGKGYVVKGFRRHAKGRMGEIRYKYCHYFVRLEEGTPPEDYYKRNYLTAPQMLEKWVEDKRYRKIIGSL